MSVYDSLVGMEEVLDEFIVESTELLEGVNEDLVHLETDPDEELVNRIFRAFHTFKGTCGFLGFNQAKDVAHVAEDLLNQLRNGELMPSGLIIDVLLESSDWFSRFINDVKERVDQEYEIDPLLARIEAARTGAAGPDVESGAAAESADKAAGAVGEPQLEATPEEVAVNGDAEVPQVEGDPVSAEQPTDGAEVAVSDGYGEAAPVETDNVTDGDGTVDAVGDSKAAAQALPRDDKIPSKPVQTIRVDMERLENLMNLAGELVLSRNQLGQAYTNLSAIRTSDAAIDNLDQVNNALGRITTEIQEAVMQMRMLPISQVFRKFPRVVRDLSRDQGKQVEFLTMGEETELDRSVIEAIGDPLLHLVRNAVDHGIEPADVREAQGKPPMGSVILKAAHEGNHIVIEVEDDGAGIDAEALTRSAVDKGVITSAEAEAMSYREKLNLIFRPGFSTAAKVTDVSGRGVGMDVVHTNISKLNGVIDIETMPGKGSRITIKLPLTLAILTGLKVNVWGENYIIPFSSIIETVKLAKSDLTKVESKWVIRFRDSVVHTLFLDDWFQVPGRKSVEDQEFYAVVVAVAEFRYALVVNGMRGQEEAVIKPLGQALGRIPGISGGTIGGDGLITLILDVPELIYHMGLG